MCFLTHLTKARANQPSSKALPPFSFSTLTMLVSGNFQLLTHFTLYVTSRESVCSSGEKAFVCLWLLCLWLFCCWFSIFLKNGRCIPQRRRRRVRYFVFKVRNFHPQVCITFFPVTFVSSLSHKALDIFPFFHLGEVGDYILCTVLKQTHFGFSLVVSYPQKFCELREWLNLIFLIFHLFLKCSRWKETLFSFFQKFE